MLWVLLSVLSPFICAVLGEDLLVKIECLADLYQTTNKHQDWHGYTLNNLVLPGLGMLQFMLAFPADWVLEDCCQKVSLRFDNQEQSPLQNNEEGYFVPKAEWTLCTPDMRQYSCYGFIEDQGHPTTDIPLGSWWLNVQHCILAEEKAISYELSTFGQAGIGDAEAPRYSGTEKVRVIKKPHTQDIKRDIPSPCLIEGGVDTQDQWFGYLATMEVPKDSSISYRFLFKIAEPSNEAPLTVLFYSSSDLSEISEQDDCDKKTQVLETPENSYKILPLSINNVWSGCGVESVNGTPSYTCEGGRTFAEKQTVHIALSSCHQTEGLRSYYFFEFQNYESDCPSVTLQNRSSTAISLHYPTLHRAINTIYVLFLTAFLAHITS